MRYDWPGNVRELRNALERAVIIAGEGSVLMSHLPASLQTRCGAGRLRARWCSGVRCGEGGIESMRVTISGTTVGQAEKDLIPSHA